MIPYWESYLQRFHNFIKCKKIPLRTILESYWHYCHGEEEKATKILHDEYLFRLPYSNNNDL